MSVNTNQNGSNKFTINLLQPELLPKKVLITLPRVVAVWCVVFVIMLGWALQTHYAQGSLNARLAVLQQENEQHTDQQSMLAAQLSARKVDRRLSDKLETLKVMMNTKTCIA